MMWIGRIKDDRRFEVREELCEQRRVEGSNGDGIEGE